MRSEHSDEQSAEQLQEVDHPEKRIAHRGICASPDAIFGSHRYPSVQVPAGFVAGMRVRQGDALFTGRAWSEPTLLRLAYAFEQ